MRFLMNTLLAHPIPRLIHAFPAKPSLDTLGSGRCLRVPCEAPLSPSEATSVAQLQLLIFWRQFNPVFQSCWLGNLHPLSALPGVRSRRPSTSSRLPAHDCARLTVPPTVRLRIATGLPVKVVKATRVASTVTAGSKTKVSLKAQRSMKSDSAQRWRRSAWVAQ